jgi:CBS domain-containing protein
VQPPESTERRPPPDPVDHDEVAGPHGAVEGTRAPAAAGADLAGARPGLTAPVGSLITRPPLFVEPDTTVAGAAREMRLAGAGAALVTDEPRGIVTDRDLRNRVVAEELATSAPVRSVMSHPVRTLPADASIEEALLLMLDASDTRRGGRSCSSSGSRASRAWRRWRGTRWRSPRRRGRSWPTTSTLCASRG